MSQMNSPEWLKDGGSTTPNTPKWTQVGTQMFTWTTTPMSRTRQQSRNIERGQREEGKMKGNKQEKREGWGKQRKRESENVSGLKTKSEKKKKNFKRNFFFFLREKTKHSNTPKAKSQHKGENYSVLA